MVPPGGAPSLARITVMLDRLDEKLDAVEGALRRDIYELGTRVAIVETHERRITSVEKATSDTKTVADRALEWAGNARRILQVIGVAVGGSIVAAFMGVVLGK